MPSNINANAHGKTLTPSSQATATLAQQKRKARNKTSTSTDTVTRSGSSLKQRLLQTGLLALASSSFFGRALAAPVPRFTGGAQPFGGLAPRDSYTVVAGDSLWNIAESHNVAVSALEAANPQVTNVNLIIPGEVLEIPGSNNAATPTSTGALTAAAAASLIAKLQSQIADLQSQIATASPEDVPALQQKQADLMQQQSDVETQLQNGGAAPGPAPTQSPWPTVAPKPTTTPAPTVAPAPTTVAPAPTTAAAPSPTSQAPSPTTAVPAPSPTGGSSASAGLATGTVAAPTSKIWTKALVQAAMTTTLDGMPGPDQWKSFDDLWAIATPLMAEQGNSAQETAWVLEGINKEASITGLDSRVILAQIMQESGGNVRVPTTGSPGSGSHANPGLMQSYNGHTFDPANPEQSILDMIHDGVEGTWGESGEGYGVADAIAATGNVWAGLRLYNSGSVDMSNLNNGFAATGQYVQQMMHKLVNGNFLS